ncbi:MAG: hypothetical protein JWN46_2829 [Acidimicrobiales bacterium]|nr:hypothetical protein [Acidimicrobiales bacterium]
MATGSDLHDADDQVAHGEDAHAGHDGPDDHGHGAHGHDGHGLGGHGHDDDHVVASDGWVLVPLGVGLVLGLLILILLGLNSSAVSIL